MNFPNAASSFRELFISRLPRSVLGAMVAVALDPAVATDAAWNALLQAIEPRVKEIASDEAHIENTYDHDGDTGHSEEKIARIEQLSFIFALQGEAGEIAAARFSQTFGSDRWKAWASPEEISILPEIAKNQSHVKNGAIIPLLREWLINEFVGVDDSENAGIALSECSRLGVLNQLATGFVLDGILRQRARSDREPWPSHVEAALEALILREETERAQSNSPSRSDADDAKEPKNTIRRL